MFELIVAFGAGLISFLSPCVLPLIPGYLSDLLGALSLLLLPTTFLASYVRSVYRFLFSGFPKTRVSSFDSEFLQEKSKNTIIEGEYVNLSERAEDTKKKG